MKLFGTIWSQILYFIALYYLNRSTSSTVNPDGQEAARQSYLKFIAWSEQINAQYVASRWIAARESVKLKVALSRTYENARDPR